MRGHLNWRMGLLTLLGGNLGCWIFQLRLILLSLWCMSWAGYIMALSSYSVLDILLPTIIIIMQECPQELKICKSLWSLSWGVSNMMLVLSITFHCHYIWGCMCSTGPFRFRWLKGYPLAHVIIIIKSKVTTLPIIIIFFRGCVHEMFVTSYSVTYCINIPGKPGFCFHYYCAVYNGVQIVGYVLACWSCSFVCTLHHLIIIIVQTYLKTFNL